MIYPNIIPDIAVDDVSVMLAIPTSVTIATGMDALTNANTLEAIRLINLWLPKAVDDSHHLETRWNAAASTDVCQLW